MKAVADEEADPVPRRHRREHLRVAHDPGEAEGGDHHEPQHHGRPEHRPDPRRASLLDQEQRDENTERDRHHERTEDRGRHLQPLDRAEDRDHRRDHAVGEQQRGSEQPEENEPAPAAPATVAIRRRRDQGDQRHDPALAPVVGAHHEHQVLEDHDQGERPEDQRQHTEDVGGRRLGAVPGHEALTDRVQRRRPDVAVDHAEGGQREGRQIAPTGDPRRGVVEFVDAVVGGRRLGHAPSRRRTTARSRLPSSKREARRRIRLGGEAYPSAGGGAAGADRRPANGVCSTVFLSSTPAR